MRIRACDAAIFTGYAVCTYWLTHRVVTIPLVDTVLYTLVIPILIVAFYRPRWLYCSMMFFLAGVCSAKVLYLSPSVLQPLLLIALSTLITFISAEILFFLGTERRHASRALFESEMQYRTLMENLPLGVFRISKDPHSPFLAANAAAAHIFGYETADSFCNLSFGALYGEPLEAIKFLERVECLGNVNGEELLLQDRHGNPVWVSIHCKAVRGAQNETAYYDGILENITEKKSAERTIIEQRMKIISASRMSALGVLASGVAHEINNPLAILSVGLEQIQDLLRSSDGDIRRAESIFKTLSRNIERIQKIVRGLRNLSRDTDEEPFKKLLLHELVEDALQVCRGRFYNEHISLQIDDIPWNVEIECRGGQISQSLMSLLNNAEDAISHLPDKWIRLHFSDLGDSITLEISDSGKGIPTALRERIFDPFFTTKDIGKGTGLGLSVAQAMIENHHGALTIQQENANTTFQICLPKSQPCKAMLAEVGAGSADR